LDASQTWGPYKETPKKIEETLRSNNTRKGHLPGGEKEEKGKEVARIVVRIEGNRVLQTVGENIEKNPHQRKGTSHIEMQRETKRRVERSSHLEKALFLKMGLTGKWPPRKGVGGIPRCSRGKKRGGGGSKTRGGHHGTDYVRLIQNGGQTIVKSIPREVGENSRGSTRTTLSRFLGKANLWVGGRGRGGKKQSKG